MNSEQGSGMNFTAKSPLRGPCPEDDSGHARKEDEEEDDDVFHIPPKPSIQSLQKWRQATLALNASRRFRYTLDLQKQEELKGGGTVNRVVSSAHAIRECMVMLTIACCLRAVHRFKEAGAKARAEAPPAGFGLGPRRLVQLLQDLDLEGFRSLGGVVGVAKSLHTNIEEGIDDSPEEIQKRRDAFGENNYPRKGLKSIWVFVWEACQDTTLIILMVAAAVALATGMWSEGVQNGWYDGTSIAVAVLLVIAVTAGSDYKQSLQFRNLNQHKENIQLLVVRSGQRRTISIFDLVVGDIVPLTIGGQVPADGVLVSGYALSIDESSMTGESAQVKKDHKKPFLMSGCKVVDGYGTMLVTAVGTNTEWGQVMTTISDDNGEETPLQVRLNGAATFIGQVGLTVAVLVFIILFIRYFGSGYQHADKHNRKPSKVITKIVDIFTIAVTIVVVAVPEGLPLAVTLTLAYSMRKMMADKSLVRHLSACETMGSATTICSDKTGTLTTNKMTVTKAWIAGDTREAKDAKLLPPDAFQTLLHGICLNSNGDVSFPKEGTEAVVTGSPTEIAILSWGLELGMDFQDTRRENFILHLESFNSTRKRAGVVYKRNTGDVQAHWKGAAEIVLDLCTHWLSSDGSIRSLTPEMALEVRNIIEGMAAASLRCVAFAYRCIEQSDVPLDEESRARWQIPDKGLILMAVVGMKDPCRPGVREAVVKCQAAGVKVRMVTGDNLYTAKAIAQECGILTPGGLAVEGREFRSYTPKQMEDCLPKIDVVARSSPMDKLLLVKSLRERGEVVAVTGDGTNDAPALREVVADIGLSMGIAGTEVAKDSSDIIILDDNFTSVVKVVRWGRSVYVNIQKFIQFQLTVNAVALVLNFVAAISTGSVPLTAVQLLWVNLIMDTLGALALATEAPTEELMQRKPVGRREPLITNIMWRNIFAQALYQLAVLMTLNFGGISILKLKGAHAHLVKIRNTIIFNTFVFCQIFNEINSRKPEKKNVFEGIYMNYLFCGVLTVTVVFQFVIVEFLNNFASTVKLSLGYWCLCIILGFISMPIAFIFKFLPVPKKPILNTLWWKRKLRRRGRTLTKQHTSMGGSSPFHEEELITSSLADGMLHQVEIEGLSSRRNPSHVPGNHLPNGIEVSELEDPHRRQSTPTATAHETQYL